MTGAVYHSGVARFLPALLTFALLSASAGLAQRPTDPRPPVVAPPPIYMPPLPGPPRTRYRSRSDDRLVQIFFDYDSASLSPTAERIVDFAAERALRCNYVGIAISGHVDTATRRSRAQPLSRRMAHTVRRALIARGLDPERIEAAGFGASRPAIVTGPGVREPINRRIEMEIRCAGDPPRPR